MLVAAEAAPPMNRIGRMPNADDQQAAHAGADQVMIRPKILLTLAIWILGEALVDVEHVGHHAHHRVGHPIGGDQPEQQQACQR
jgi:hypothetical protein